MSAVKELLRTEADGTLSFGDYELAEKTKLADFEYKGDLYKVKTFKDITKLERNGMLVYESDPGTAVHSFNQTGEGVSFTLEAQEDVQVILGLEEETEYRVTVGGQDAGMDRTNMGGKLVLSIEVSSASVDVQVTKA